MEKLSIEDALRIKDIMASLEFVWLMGQYKQYREQQLFKLLTLPVADPAFERQAARLKGTIEGMDKLQEMLDDAKSTIQVERSKNPKSKDDE